MLRITVELVPLGFEGEKKTLAVMEIANDGTGNRDIGNYIGELKAEPAYTGVMPDGVRRGRLLNYSRRGQSVWSLVGAFLKMWGHTKHPEKYFQKDSEKKIRKRESV